MNLIKPFLRRWNYCYIRKPCTALEFLSIIIRPRPAMLSLPLSFLKSNRNNYHGHCSEYVVSNRHDHINGQNRVVLYTVFLGC